MNRVVDELPVQARIPADLDAPDRIMLGLTTRQVAVLAVAVVPIYLAWQVLAGRVPIPVLVATTSPVAALAAAVAMGRRDGVSLDAWLLAALTHRRGPRRLLPVHPSSGTPDWAPLTTTNPTAETGRLGMLRLPTSAIDDDGTLVTGATAVALVASTTVTANLNSSAEQAAQVGAFARWLNALTSPAQIVLSTTRLDLGTHAERVVEQAHDLTSPALAGAAVDYAWFLLDLMESHDPLQRTVTIAVTSPSVSRAGTVGSDVQRRAAATADALSAVGVRCRVLSAGEVTAVLSAAADPYGSTDATSPRTAPGIPVTATTTAWDEYTDSAIDDLSLDDNLADEPAGRPASWGRR
ncbi:PrgI family protein [Kineosporia sp. R_H_3]|uniref:PrgI family protein n=1 Tax=Kineosporia sp. R_H_3 TaxID=1961848 RepID=UPI000B4BC447|nr:PrgI family protein [Kineosporia sp. R_H_3]